MKDTTAHAILSIIRELTSNAIRHGNAAVGKIAGCVENGTLLFSVRDNGRGFDPSDCNGPAQGYFGLKGIRHDGAARELVERSLSYGESRVRKEPN